MQARLDDGGVVPPLFIVDSTKLRAWMTCPRKFQYGYLEHLAPAYGTSIDLDFGKAVHYGLEVFEGVLSEGFGVDEALKLALHESRPLVPEIEGETKKTQQTLARVLIWYAEQFYRDVEPVYRVVATEQPFCIKLIDLFRGGHIPTGLAVRAGLSSSLFQLYNVALAGRLDSIVEGPSPGEFWVRERKTTGRYLDSNYFGQFSPDIQISLYTWIAKLLYPELNLQGVVLEAFQVGVTFVRIERREIKRFKEQSLETLESILIAIKEMSEAGLFGLDTPMLPLPIRESGCNANGRLCQFRDLCNAHPLQRKLKATQSYKAREPWSPLDGASPTAIAGLPK